MDTGAVLDKFLRTEDRNILITDESEALVYSSPVMDFPTERVLKSIQSISGDFTEQEIYDREEDKSLFCSMACGLSFGSGEYDYDELYAQADKFMFENKKRA